MDNTLLPSVISSLTVSALFFIILKNIYKRLEKVETKKVSVFVSDERNEHTKEALKRGEERFDKILEKIDKLSDSINKLNLDLVKKYSRDGDS